jgi:hypothetical protein
MDGVQALNGKTDSLKKHAAKKQTINNISSGEDTVETVVITSSTRGTSTHLTVAHNSIKLVSCTAATYATKLRRNKPDATVLRQK